MAVELHSGDFRYSVSVWKPLSTKNDEGGVEKTFSLSYTTLAAIRSINTRKLNEAAATALLHSQDFYVRYSADPINRMDATTGWEVRYKGKTYVISEVLRVNGNGDGDEWGRFIRMTAQLKETGTLTAGSGSGSSGGSGVSNYPSFTFDPLTGTITFPGPEDGNFIQLTFQDPNNPYFAYVNDEGTGLTSSATPTLSLTQEYLTPGKPVLVRWRKAAGSIGLTPWNEYLLTATRLSRRWLRVWYFVGGNPIEIYPGFPPMKVYSVTGAEMGVVSTITDLIALWNSNSDNAAFGQIIGYRTMGFYEVQVEPDADEVLYPVKYILVQPA